MIFFALTGRMNVKVIFNFHLRIEAIFMEIKKPDEAFEEVAVDWIVLKVVPRIL